MPIRSQPGERRDLLLIAAYATSAFCAVAAGLYALGYFEPPPYVVQAAPLWAVILWVHRDTQRRGLPMPFDWGFFLLLAWPVLLPWHVFRTRGRRGWRLLVELLLIAFASWLAAAAVATARYLAGMD